MRRAGRKCKLVATETRQELSVLRYRLQPTGHHFETMISRGVTMHVIDVLEPVQVHQKQGEWLRAPKDRAKVS